MRIFADENKVSRFKKIIDIMKDKTYIAQKSQGSYSTESQ
jgi:hypothetical protein